MKTISTKKPSSKKAFNSSHHTFLDLFKEQVRTIPYETAVSFAEKSLTYHELDVLSSNLAYLLEVKGFASGQVIALGLNNSLEVVVGMLAIFKVGGIYLPIDLNYPDVRINHMLEDARPSFVITERSQNKRSLVWESNVILIDNLHDYEFDINLKRVSPRCPAYIFYTSGTTGKPKGVIVSHSSLTHAVLAYKCLHPEKYITLMTGSISFDPSLLIITFTLASGGKLCIPQNNGKIDPEDPIEYIKVIKRHRVEYLLCTPSFYSSILDRKIKLPSLKCLDLCGEKIPNSLPKRHSIINPNSDLYNVYGPTEYAMGATAALIYDAKTKIINKISIGKPYFVNSVYIFDENFCPVSHGEKGEIFIGGPGLAIGYLNNETLSKEKFLFFNLQNKKKFRLYRTGDMGSFLPDGNIIFLGRRDQQIKILGHRIELVEVEQSICEYPEVSEAVVLLEKDAKKNKMLVAYISTFSTKEILEDLKRFLKDTLPSFMIPSLFVIVKEWPYNQNGKIDRKKLALCR